MVLRFELLMRWGKCVCGFSRDGAAVAALVVPVLCFSRSPLDCMCAYCSFVLLVGSSKQNKNVAYNKRKSKLQIIFAGCRSSFE